MEASDKSKKSVSQTEQNQFNRFIDCSILNSCCVINSFCYYLESLMGWKIGDMYMEMYMDIF